MFLPSFTSQVEALRGLTGQGVHEACQDPRGVQSRVLEQADRQRAEKQYLLTRPRRSETQGSGRGGCMEPLGNREMTSPHGVPQDSVILSLGILPQDLG